MATIGQIVYNLEDQNNPGMYLSTSEDGSNINSHDRYTTPQDGKRNIFESVFGDNDVILSKLGIQAPPGTRFILNGKNIMIGTSGLYELDEESLPEIKKNNFKFIAPVLYELDQTLTQELLNSSIEALNTLEAERIEAISEIKPDENGNLATEDYEAYLTLNQDFIEKYNEAQVNYLYALSGVYVKVKNPNTTLYNIIIDYIQEGESAE